jgi:hypothetical protein
MIGEVSVVWWMKTFPVKSSEEGLSKAAFNRVNPVKCGAYLTGI